jgi:hypothetical protein
MSQTLVIQHLPPEAVHKLLDYLPDYVKGALQEKASELDCPLEAVVEMALASFLDAESFSFEEIHNGMNFKQLWRPIAKGSMRN